MNRVLIVIFLSFAISACGADVEPPSDNAQAFLSGQSAALLDDTPEAVGVLAWINSEAATFEVLDVEVGLYRNTAYNIALHIRGRDGAHGTRDDNPVHTIAELDAIPKVGPNAIRRILQHVENIGGVPRVFVEGHSLTDAQVIRILETINHYSREAIDHHIGIDKRAAYNLVARRPFGNMEEVAAVPYVGPATIGLLRDYADLRHPGDEDVVVEGVVFTPEQAVEVVMLANLASIDELDMAVGLDARAAQNIKAAGQLDDLSALASIPYVGRSALTKMREYLPHWDEEQHLQNKR